MEQGSTVPALSAQAAALQSLSQWSGRQQGWSHQLQPLLWRLLRLLPQSAPLHSRWLLPPPAFACLASHLSQLLARMQLG